MYHRFSDSISSCGFGEPNRMKPSEFWDFKIDDYFGKAKRGKGECFFFFFDRNFFFCLYSIFFFFVLIKISEEKENFFFVYLRFWKFWKFWKKGNFFFIHFREKFQREKERKRNFFFLLWNENFKNLPFKRDLILWKNGCTRRSGKKKKESAFT